jgi:AraC-like DNA-binding protein
MPLPDPGREEDAVAGLVRMRRIQRAVFEYAREHLPQSTAAPIQDYGVALLTSTSPGAAAEQRRELKDRAEAVRALIREKFGLRSVAGVGRAVPPADALLPSWEDALLAMHASVQMDREVLFYGQKDLPVRRYGYAELRAAAARLIEAVAGGDTAAGKPAADQYVRVLLAYSNQRLEVVRGQFLALMFETLEGLHKRFLFSEDDLEQASRRMGQGLEKAMSVYQLLEAFKVMLSRLQDLAGRARGGPRQLRLESTLQYLRENYREPLRLPQVARMAGFSVAAFSRAFKEATGTSFAVYLRQIRVDEAKRLLRASPNTVVEISQRTGFESSHRLIRAFKQQTSQTPGQYREVHKSGAL